MTIEQRIKKMVEKVKDETVREEVDNAIRWAVTDRVNAKVRDFFIKIAQEEGYINCRIENGVRTYLQKQLNELFDGENFDNTLVETEVGKEQKERFIKEMAKKITKEDIIKYFLK